MRFNEEYSRFEDVITFCCFADAKNFIMEVRLQWSSHELPGINLIHDKDYIVFLSFVDEPDKDILNTIISSHNGAVDPNLTSKDIVEMMRSGGTISIGDASLIMFLAKNTHNYVPLIKDLLVGDKFGKTKPQIIRETKAPWPAVYDNLLRLEQEGKVDRIVVNGKHTLFRWNPTKFDECGYIS